MTWIKSHRMEELAGISARESQNVQWRKYHNIILGRSLRSDSIKNSIFSHIKVYFNTMIILGDRPLIHGQVGGLDRNIYVAGQAGLVEPWMVNPHFNRWGDQPAFQSIWYWVVSLHIIRPAVICILSGGVINPHFNRSGSGWSASILNDL